jgi:hypothetical protein
MANDALAKLKAKKEAFKKQQEEFDRPKADWFSIKPNQTLKVQFLQELSKNAENYNGSYGKSPVILPQHNPDSEDEDERAYDIGLFLAVSEHTAHGADGFKSRALDTIESEGKDYAEEMYRRNKEETGWKKKENLYITVAVDRGKREPSVEILSRGIHSEFVDDLMDMDSEEGITGRTFAIKKGSSKSSPWRIKELVGEEMDVDGLVPYDLARDAVRHVPYDEQKEFYGRNYTPENSTPKDADDDEDDFFDNDSVLNGSSDDDDPDW